jgi:cyclopropane-fatty-acyl-phospholipid synthase
MLDQSSKLPAWTLRSRLFSTAEGQNAGIIRNFVTSFARDRAFEALRWGLKKGQMVVEDATGRHVFPHGADETTSKNVVVLKVVNDNVWVRIMLSHDIGLAEAYMEGDFHVSSLKGLLNLWLDNREGMASFRNPINSFFAYYSALAINMLGRQTCDMALHNVQVAYDISNDFYETFLSKEMMYSCAMWSDEENGPNGDLTVGPKPGDLEAAQHRKVHHILKLARVRAGSRLLEIGSGWGAMSIQAAKLGCAVDTVTLSSEQKAMVEKRAAEEGVADRITVHLCDYRRLPASFKHSFDAFVSSEMIEAVGIKQWHEYFGMMNWALKEDRAAAVITATTQPEHRWSEYQPDDFARHYHWPNTFLPSATSLASEMQRLLPGKFVLSRLEDHGVHYPRTLREWGRRLDANFNKEAREYIQQKHPELRDEKKLQAFINKWHYMFTYAEVGYARAYTSLNCWTFARPENIVEACG